MDVTPIIFKNGPKRLLVASFWLACLFVSCNSESAPDCLQNSGALVRKVVSTPNFDKITVFEKVGLVLKQGPELKVEVETGEFLLDEVQVTVDDERLILRNENGCNLFREYGQTKVYVTAPNITEIRSSTGLTVASDGVLTYPNLRLVSESFVNTESETTDGSFDLELDTADVSILVNGIAYFQLKGETEFLGVSIAAGDSRIAAQNLQAGVVDVSHRGSNDILVNPQQILKGEIKGTGNVISFNRPSTVEVVEVFQGKLVFKD